MTYQVVVSFRVKPAEGVARDAFERVMAAHIRQLRQAAVVGALSEGSITVHVREVGAAGERSEHEGTFGLP